MHAVTVAQQLHSQHLSTTTLPCPALPCPPNATLSPKHHPTNSPLTTVVDSAPETSGAAASSARPTVAVGTTAALLLTTASSSEGSAWWASISLMLESAGKVARGGQAEHNWPVEVTLQALVTLVASNSSFKHAYACQTRAHLLWRAWLPPQGWQSLGAG